MINRRNRGQRVKGYLEAVGTGSDSQGFSTMGQPGRWRKSRTQVIHTPSPEEQLTLFNQEGQCAPCKGSGVCPKCQGLLIYCEACNEGDGVCPECGGSGKGMKRDECPPTNKATGGQ